MKAAVPGANLSGDAESTMQKVETKTHGIGNVEGFVHRKMEHS